MLFSSKLNLDFATCLPLQVNGHKVAVHLSRGRKVDELVPPPGNIIPEDDSSTESSINQLLALIRAHPDKEAAVAAALSAVHGTKRSAAPGGTQGAAAKRPAPSTASQQESDALPQPPLPLPPLPPPPLPQPPQQAQARHQVPVNGEPAHVKPEPGTGSSGPVGPLAGSRGRGSYSAPLFTSSAMTSFTENKAPEARDLPLPPPPPLHTLPYHVPDPTTFLDMFPGCKKLVEQFRCNANTVNKTPLSILNEYASRNMMEVRGHLR